MRKFIWALFIVVLMSCQTSAQGDSLPIYHKESKGFAPYERVNYLDYVPFEANDPLLRVDALGIKMDDCLVVYEGNQAMLIDGGERWRFSRVQNYMREHHLDGFDVLFLTHPHDDHMGGQIALIKAGYRVGKVIGPDNSAYKDPMWLEYQQLLADRKIPYEVIHNEDVLHFGNAKFTFYQWIAERQSLNSRSVAAMLSFGDARMFLAADISGATEYWLLDTYGADAFDCDIYKAAHHGISRTPSEFLSAMSPDLAIITSTPYASPDFSQQMERSGIPRYYVSNGTICMRTDGHSWYVNVEPLDY